MVAIHHKHEMPAGVLAIEIIQPEESAGPSAVRLEFECAETGATWEASYSYPDLCAIRPIFGESQELLDTLREPPAISFSDDKADVIVRITARVRTREYYADLKLTRRVYDEDKKDVIELRAENRVLRRRLAKVEDNLDKLASMMLLIPQVYEDGLMELVGMMKSPLRALETYADQDKLIDSLQYGSQGCEWFRSLNPDLRKFRSMEDAYVLPRLIRDINSQNVDFIRFLISININVNEGHNGDFPDNDESWCLICGWNIRDGVGHTLTPLDVVRGRIRNVETTSGSKTQREIEHLHMLREVKHMLIKAGAKSEEM